MNSCKKSLSNFLLYISVGKYHTKLYHRGGRTHSSLIGGLFNLALIITLSIAAFILLSNALNESTKRYTINQKALNLFTHTPTFEGFQDSLLDQCT
jgi:hypothetical protein